MAVAVDHRHAVAGDRLADRAGFRNAERTAGREHEVAFGLAVEFVDGETEGRLAPFVGFRAERFPARADRTHLDVVAALRIARRAQHAQRGRRDEGVADFQARHQRVGVLRIEFLHPPRHHRHAIVQARQQHVEQPAGPGPVGRRPDAVAGLREEVVVGLDPGKMPDQHTMAMQRALRLAGGARGVDHHRRIVGGGIDRRKVGRGARQARCEIERAVGLTVKRKHELEIGQDVANLGDAFDALRTGDQSHRAGILQAKAERIDSEQHRQRQRDGAELVDRDMARRHFRRLRQQDGDAVAARDAVRAQHIGEAVGSLS